MFNFGRTQAGKAHHDFTTPLQIELRDEILAFAASDGVDLNGKKLETFIVFLDERYNGTRDWATLRGLCGHHFGEAGAYIVEYIVDPETIDEDERVIAGGWYDPDFFQNTGNHTWGDLH